MEDKVHPAAPKYKLEKMPKATRKRGEEMGEGSDLHGVVNPKEARSHARVLDEAMEMIQDEINKDNTKDIAEITIWKIKTILGEMFPMLEDASVEVMVEAIKDCKFRVLQPWLDETEQFAGRDNTHGGGTISH